MFGADCAQNGPNNVHVVLLQSISSNYCTRGVFEGRIVEKIRHVGGMCALRPETVKHGFIVRIATSVHDWYGVTEIHLFSVRSNG